ncbi:SNF2 superfamily RAD26-like protein [Stachybotrys elegans]|uniref:SNF2 superfamily RAD26-like protein n=1 Tax=Stachybotrys elegans TaxID=80388 RepID=A0A8K0SYT6_9HYPO|nr:SNF2 superfamily RAD26-like protein [Stachybotrys elegans]
MAPSNSRQIIEIIDEADGKNKASLSATPGTHLHLSHTEKRKREEVADFSEKVQWTDESDDGLAKLKKRKGKGKRKSTGNGKRGAKDHDKSGAGEALDLDDTPEYLQERRRAFDAAKKQYHDAALMLPPDYTDIDLGHTGTLGDLEERPKFSDASGVKPSRPYKDIPLPKSAGLIPASIAQYLRDYQVEGVEFLHRKFVFQEGGILGDDMGLGKTVQVAAFLAVAFGKTGDERDDKRMRQVRFCSGRWYPRILIICPGSLIMNWRNELNRWGWWHIDIFHGANKDDILGTARSGLLEIMITTYDTYKNSRSSVNMVQWDAVIADECHRLKDKYSETTKAMKEVNALCRIGLTGTAIQNRYEELYTLLDWTNPGHFGTVNEWSQTITKPLTVGQSHEATVAQLSLARQTAKKLVENLLPRYFLRRMKTLIAEQLPKKTDRVVFCPLTDFQKEAYENFVNSEDVHTLKTVSEKCEHGSKKGWCCYKLLSDGTPWQKIIFPSMIALQKLANHLTLLIPSSLDSDSKHEKELNTLRTCLPHGWKPLYHERDQIRNLVNPEYCGKWKVLKKLLKFWHSNGDKVLVFSHSVRLLRILQHLFTNTSYTISYLDGSLTYEQRQEVVDNFNTDPTQFVFLISTKAGGVGLNITSANKVVIVDPHWNPSYDLQAQDRAYRIGQIRDVEVFRLISLGTVEEIVYARQIYKQQQANIGYTASSERRYFKGVQQDTERKGEIFGLSNIFTLHSESGLLKEIVNKTNIAEAKAGVNLVDVDMEKAAKDEENLSLVKHEDADGEDGGASQLAALLAAENQQQLLESRKAKAPKSDAVQAILTSAGVQYTHDNSEVIGSSKVEEQLSRRAVMTTYSEADVEGQSALFADSDEDTGGDLHSIYNPPEDVMLRQFCEMAREFGFPSATEFALVVEGWSQEARRNCLDTFYKRRKAILAEEAAEQQRIKRSETGVKSETCLNKDDVEKMSLKKQDPKEEDTNMESHHDLLDPKQEDRKLAKQEDKSLVKTEERKVKQEGAFLPKVEKVDREEKAFLKAKRDSIFLSDDDEDDEL